MASTLTVIWWRDIPSQVMAGQGRAAQRTALPDRFQVAIDKAAARAGLEADDAYMAEWKRVTRPCGDDLAAEASAEAARLDAAYPADRLNGLVANGGVAGAAGDPTS